MVAQPSHSKKILSSEISRDEILTAIKNLKNAKAPGLDQIINEHIKASKNAFLPIYYKLFNIILDSGVFPEQWSVGCIKPVYKNKGDSLDPRNYRPITVLSCLGKLFTSILNDRLNRYLELNEILTECQAGFRKSYSTIDHIFSLYALNELMKSQKKKLFCCFVDFSSAFDNVWRAGLWSKLLQSNVNGKIIAVIKNMYNDIKSCVSLMGENSSFFASLAGVRQGENLSPVLFSLYLNDLSEYLLSNHQSGITVANTYDNLVFYFRIIVLLYADDTVIVGSNDKDLQNALDDFNHYCHEWKLKVNLTKTKVVIFGARNTNQFHFVLDDKHLEITDRYKYLGVVFSQSRSFLNAREHLAEQAKKAMYLLFTRINNLYLPIDLQLKLFDHTVVPIMTYGCEVLGFENLDMFEKIHTEFLRKIIRCRKSTPLKFLYAELGRYPIDIVIKTRIISFWNKILLDKQTKISFILYKNLKDLARPPKWIVNVKNILDSVGRSELWLNQNSIQTFSIKQIVKQTLVDQFLQSWHCDINISSREKNYKIFKETVELEKYFTVLPRHLYLKMVHFRTSNHRFPIETGRWNNTEINDRKCPLCETNSIGDEFHYLLECPFFLNDRKRYVSDYYFKRPNIPKFKQLLTMTEEHQLTKLAMYMGIIMKHF